MKWLVFFLLSFILIYTPFERGLFFNRDLYIYSFVITITFLIWYIVNSFRKNESLPSIYYGLFVLPMIYCFTFLVAESPSKNFESLFSWLTFICFFILLLWVRGEKKIEGLLPYIFTLAGIVISFFAIFGAWGWVSYQDVLLGERFTGPFQYANTFAAVIGAFWLYTLVYLSRRTITWYAVLIFSLPLVAYGVGFLHSYSRGALLVFPLAWIVGLLCLRLREQVAYTLYTIISFVGSFVVFRIMVGQERAEATNPGLWIFIATTLIVMMLCMSLYYVGNSSFFKKIQFPNGKIYLRLVLPFIIFISSIFLWLDIQNEGLMYNLLPSSFQERISSIDIESSSALGRTNMFTDAWNMSKDAPIFGLGGDGWKSLYTTYQTKPYLSNEIHNGYLEVLLNTGWLGLLIFIVAFIFLFGQIIYRARTECTDDEQPLVLAAIPALLMIFIHAAIDFDFSYGVVWFIILWLFAMSVSFKPFLPTWGQFKLSRLISYKNMIRFRRISRVILGLGIFIGAIYVYRFYVADQQIVKAQAMQSIDVNDGLTIFGKATSYNPYNIDNWISLAHVNSVIYNNSHQQTDLLKVIDNLNKVEKLESKNPMSLYKIANIYAGINEWELATKYIESAMYYDKFNVNFYDNAFKYKFLSSQEKHQNGEEKMAIEFLTSLVKDYETYLDWFNTWKNKPLPDRRKLTIEKQSLLIIADSYRMLKLYPESLEILKSLGAVIDKELYDEQNDKIMDKAFEVHILNDVISKHLNDVIVISVKDEATFRLSLESKSLLESLGSNISDLAYRGSYVSVISGGKIVFEDVNNEASITIDQDNTEQLRNIFMNKPFAIQSAGNDVGNYSSILVDGVEYSTNNRGINMVIFDVNMNPVEIYHFDTYLSEMKVIPIVK